MAQMHGSWEGPLGLRAGRYWPEPLLLTEIMGKKQKQQDLVPDSVSVSVSEVP